MAIQLGDAVIRVTGDITEFNKSLKTAQKNAQSSFGAIAQGARQVSIALAAAGAAGIAGLGGAVKVAATFEKAITTAAAVTGRSGKEFDQTRDKLSALAKELGQTTVFSAREAANAFVVLGRKGIDVASLSIKELTPLMDLAAGQNISLAESAQLIVSTLKQYNFGFQESARIADVFTAAANNSDTTMQKLSASLPIVGALAAESGVKFEELVTALGVLFDRGIEASTAATGLRRTISTLFNPTKEAQEVFAELGITWDDIDLKTRSLSDIMKTFGDKGMGAAEAFKIFGQRAANTVIVLSGAEEGFDKLNKKIEDSAGSSKKLAEKRLATLEGAFILLTSALEGVIIPLGESLIPLMTKLTEVITPALQGLAKFIEANPEVTQVVTVTAGAISSLLFIIGSLGIALSTILVPVAAFVQAGFELKSIWIVVGNVLKAIAAIFTSTAAAIAAAAAAAIGAWVFAAVSIAREWENFKKFWADVWDGIKSIFKGAVELMTGNWEALIRRVRDGATEIWNTIKALPRELLVQMGLGRVADFLNLPNFASGGTMARSGLAIVGEQGPELVHLPAGSRVDNAETTAGKIGPTFNAPLINVQAVNASSQSDVDGFMQEAGRVVRNALLDAGMPIGALG
jgi:TP901 family phage tail tape measure protein